MCRRRKTWQRLTVKARSVIYQAQEEASRLGSGTLATEHILLGVIGKPDTLGAQLLKQLDVDMAVLERALRASVTKAADSASKDMYWTDEAKRAIDHAYQESQALGDNYIGSEHLVLGLCRDLPIGAGYAFAGINVEMARQTLAEMRGKWPPSDAGQWRVLSENARRAVFFGQEAARGLGQTLVSTEHLLLGILRDIDSVAERVLLGLGVSRELVLSSVTEAVTRWAADDSVDMFLAPDSQRAIDFAFDEVHRLRECYMGTDHLLAGLIVESEEIATHVLLGLGVDLEGVRRVMDEFRVVTFLMGTPPANPAA